MKTVKPAGRLLLVLALCLSFAAPSLAASHRTVRVGCFTQPDAAAPGGYDHELTESLAHYAHWDCEYVYTTLADCLSLLEQGKLDLVSGVIKTPQRLEQYNFAQTDSGLSYATLCVRRGENHVAYEEFDALDGMTVGVISGSGHIADLENYCTKNDFSVKTISYPDKTALSQALAQGEVDAILSSSQHQNDNEWVVARFAPSPLYYISAKENRAVLNELNSAMLQLRIDMPQYLPDLYTRHYGTITQETPLFTRSELQYIENQRPLRCLYYADWRPISYTDASGQFAGIAADTFAMIAEYTGLTFEFIPYTGQPPLEQLQSGEIDILCSYEQDCDWDQNDALVLTLPYLNAPIAMVRNTRDPDAPLILPAHRFSPTQFLSSMPRKSTVKYAESESACIEAVRRGEAGTTFINTHVANFLLQRTSKGALSITSMEAHRDDLCIAVSTAQDALLPQILSNAIRFLSDIQMNQIITANTVRQDDLSMGDFLNMYPSAALSLAVLLLFAVIFFLSIVLLQRSHSNQKIYDLLYVDKLTGAWNLNKFRLEATKLLSEHPKGYALISTDMDNFKSCNETYGYARSDQILKVISNVTRTSLQRDEAFARISADQFVALLRLTNPSALSARLMRLNEAINNTLAIDYGISRVSLISGVCFCESEETDLAYLIDCANEARKSVKGSHRSVYAVFDETMHHLRQYRRELEAAMEQALHNGHFVAYYQPKFEITTRRIVGAEALARWMHPEKGLIPPSDFIPLFEQNGFVTELDFYIYEQVCKLLRRRLDQGLPVVPISTNFSRVDLTQKGFCARLKTVADSYRIPPCLLELELTESAVEQSTDQLIALSEELKSMGFLLSMDDFGSGYSSLNMLKKLPVDTLKLDKAFLQAGLSGEKERILMEGFVSMAHRMNLIVVCEGVEYDEQAQFLLNVGCHLAQGYLFARPMPEGDFEAQLHGNTILCIQ